MAVTLNNFQHLNAGDSYTAPAGSNRLVVIIPMMRELTSFLVNELRMGSQVATALIANQEDATSGNVLISGVYYIKEADIPAGANAIDIDWIDNQGAGLGTITTNKGPSASVAFTLFDFDQASTPYFENPVSVLNQNVTGTSVLSNNYGANTGKFAIGACLSAGSINELYTITSTLGDLVSQASTSAVVGGSNASAVHWRVNKIDSLASDSESTQFTVDYPSSGSSSAGARMNQAYALVFDGVASNPAVTVDQANIEPGGVLSGTYSNFTAGTPPTSPISISDGTNSITVPVVISDNGDGTGTYTTVGAGTGALPVLPSVGTSISFVLFGNVTVTLDDA